MLTILIEMWWDRYVSHTKLTTRWAFGSPSSLFSDALIELLVNPVVDVDIGTEHLVEMTLDVSIRKRVFHDMLNFFLNDQHCKLSIDTLKLFTYLAAACCDETVVYDMLDVICQVYATFPWRGHILMRLSKIVLNCVVNSKTGEFSESSISTLQTNMFDFFARLFVNNPGCEPIHLEILDFHRYIDDISLSTLGHLCASVTIRRRANLDIRDSYYLCALMISNEHPFNIYCQPFDEHFPLFDLLISQKMIQGLNMQILVNLMLGKYKSTRSKLPQLPLEMFRELKSFLI